MIRLNNGTDGKDKGDEYGYSYDKPSCVGSALTRHNNVVWHGLTSHIHVRDDEHPQGVIWGMPDE